MKDSRFMSTKIKILYLLLAILVVYTLWPSGNDQPNLIQSSFITEDEAGKMKVFGITLGETTLGEAETILASRAKRALFIMPLDENKNGETPTPEHNIEAFFPNMPDNSKMLLGLATIESDMAQIRHKAHNPIAFPSGNIKLKIADEHQDMVNAMSIITLTAIPRISLSPEDIHNKFGEPTLLHVQDEILHFLYPALGLDVILDKSGEAMLQFVEPGKFSQVLQSLGLNEEMLNSANHEAP